jgi:hypothetical protein
MFFYYIEMNKKSKSKRKTIIRKKIKQVGCSLKKKSLKQSGGDAYNAVPASKIYPLEDYSVDAQRANIDTRQQLGGRRSFRKYSRKYYKKISGGSNFSYLDMAKPFDAHSQDQIYNKAAPFYV